MRNCKGMTFLRLDHIGGSPVANLCELEASPSKFKASQGYTGREKEREGGREGGGPEVLP